MSITPEPLPPSVPQQVAAPTAALVFACRPDNDLYRALTAQGQGYPRCDRAQEAIDRALHHASVLLLADGYPERTTPLTPELFEQAARKDLRVFVEYPDWLPDLPVGPPRATRWERVVVSSNAFGPALERMRILAIHDCQFVPVQAAQADLVAARVAGFDTAVFGLPATGVHPLLFPHPRGDLLVATTKLSQFVTARYAPADAWRPVWQRVLRWLCRGGPTPEPAWTPVVRPTYARDDELPEDVEGRACLRGVAWYRNARLLVHPAWQQMVEEAAAYPDHVGPAPGPDLPVGDGSLGLLEGFNSSIRCDGRQQVRWWLRNDCMNESAMAFAFAAALDRSSDGGTVAANLHDFVFFKSPLAQGSRADPHSPSFGLLGWNTTPKYHQQMDGFGVYYGDDNARSLLGTMATAGLLKSARWDEPLLRCLLANLRTTGKLGFRDSRIDEEPLQRNGWRHYQDSAVVNYAPHYEAYLWACFLWAYARTGYAPFLDGTAAAIRATMKAYPDQWQWTNGIQQERARMLLPLAWLVRVQDTPEHRAWLRRMSGELLAGQDESGALREELGPAGKGDFAPPKSNEDYGTSEAPLIQNNGDRLSDLLYTTNFAFLGLHEAAAATGEPHYRQAEDRLARFLCRIQARSEQHPGLDGAWFRAFDYGRWDYWASNADAGWGAWSVETGWTQAWITSVLAMRQLRTSLWDVTAGSQISAQMGRVLPMMFPG